MAFSATRRKTATITGAAGAGTDVPLFLQVHPNGIPPDAFTANGDASAEINNAAVQGVCYDGSTYYYFSDSENLYKMTRGSGTFSQVLTRDVTGDDPVAKTQINGLDYFNGKLYAGWLNGSTEEGGVIEYDPADLTPTGNYWQTDLDGNCEGGAWRADAVRGDEYFAVFSAEPTIQRYNSSFVLQATYDMTDAFLYASRTGQGWYQGGYWHGDIFVVCMHGDPAWTGTARIEGYAYDSANDTLTRVFSIATPVPSGGSSLGQQQCCFVGDEMVIAERTNGNLGGTWKVFDITWRPNCIDLEGEGGRADFGDVVIAAPDGTVIANDGEGYLEHKRDGAYANLWFRHPGDLGTDKDVYVYFGDASQVGSYEAASTFFVAYHDFEDNTVGGFTKSYASGSASVQSSDPFQGTYNLRQSVSTGGVTTPDGTYMAQAGRRVVGYIKASGAGLGGSLGYATVVSGSTIRRGSAIIEPVAVKMLTDSGTITLDASAYMSGRWIRVEVFYDYDAELQQAIFREGIDQTFRIDSGQQSLNDAVPGAGTSYDLMPFRVTDLDLAFSLPWPGFSADPSLGEFGAAATVTGPTITSVGGDDEFDHAETSVLVVGTNLGDGNSTITISPSDDIDDADATTQTVTAGNDTQLGFTANLNTPGIAGGGTGYLFVTNNQFVTNPAGFPFTRPAPASPPAFTSIGADDSLSDGETTVVVVGANFIDGNGTFTIAATDNVDDGNATTPTVSSGNDTQLVLASVDLDGAGIAEGAAGYAFYTTSGNATNPAGFEFTRDDETPPVLSLPAALLVTATSATPVVTTDEANGIVYVVIVPDGDEPSVAQIKAGEQSDGSPALASASQAVSSTGVQIFAALGGLEGETAYEEWFVHTDAAGNDSDAVTVGFVTKAEASAAVGITRPLTVGGLSAGVTPGGVV